MTEKDHRIPNKPMSPCGPSRHFAATQDVCRFRNEADMSRLVRPGQSVENDPHRKWSVHRSSRDIVDAQCGGSDQARLILAKISTASRS
jgi:hypothetical protein